MSCIVLNSVDDRQGIVTGLTDGQCLREGVGVDVVRKLAGVSNDVRHDDRLEG